MKSVKRILYTASLAFLLIPWIAMAGKPDPDACPYEGAWALFWFGFGCLQDDPQLISHGGWPSPSEASNPLSEISVDSLKLNLLELQLTIGVKEVDGKIWCSVSGREEVEEGTYEEFDELFPNPDTGQPYTVDEARNCAFFNRYWYDFLVEADIYCE